MSLPLLRVRLQAGYGKQMVLEDVRFDLEKGHAMGLIGTSGAGKSTLVMSLLGLLPWRGGRVTGEVSLEGENLLTMPEREARRLRGRKIALVPQSPMSALNGAISLRTHFEEAWRAHETRGRTALETRVMDLMEKVSLPTGVEFLSRRPGEISVGQAQRVMIAMALLHGPSLVVADEPTSALDPTTQVGILRLLRTINRRDGVTLLYISHDLISVLQICDRVSVLDGGRIVECLDARMMGEQARHPATMALLRSLPVPAEVLSRYIVGDGEDQA